MTGALAPSLVGEHQLRDGRTVRLRPITRADAGLERAFLATLSDECRRLRFMKFVNATNEQLIAFLTNVDGERHVAIACTFRDGADEILVGQSRYIVIPDTDGCEFAIVVADAWQGTGIAGLLMEALFRVARERGLRTMEGVVMRENRSMLRFVRALGFRHEPCPDDPTLTRVVKDLQASA